MKLLLSVISLFFCLNAHADTIFSYSPDDIERLRSESSKQVMSKDELKRWDAVAGNEVKRENLTSFEQIRIFTYLYVAQSDAANLSFKTTGAYKGSLGPISQKVLNVFLKTPYQMLSPADPFSETLADIVFKKVQDRINK